MLFGDVGASRLRIIEYTGGVEYHEFDVRGNHLEIGMEEFERNLKSVSERITRGPHELCVFGLAGMGERCEDEGNLSEMFSKIFRCKKAIVCGDSVIAYAGAFAGIKRGILVHSGTGSFVMAFNGSVFKKYGGWGHILGDDGSGYRLALDAFREVVKFWEGWGKDSCLVKAAAEFGISGKRDLLKMLYVDGVKKADVAKFAEKVLLCAQQGDEVAEGVIRKNVKSLLEPLKTASDFSGSKSVSYSGGVFNCRVFRDIVRDQVEEMGFSLRDPEYPPVLGGLFVAEWKGLLDATRLAEEMRKALKRSQHHLI